MKNRFECGELGFFPAEIWQLIFQLGDFYLRDIAAILRINVSFSSFVNDISKVIYIKHFPHLHRKLSDEKKKKLTLSDLQEVFESQYEKLSPLEKNLMSFTKDGELEKILDLPLEETWLTFKDSSGFTIVDWARRKHYQTLLDYSYSLKKRAKALELIEELFKRGNSREDKENSYKKEILMLAIEFLQPIKVIDQLLMEYFYNPYTGIVNPDPQFSKYMYMIAAKSGHIDFLKWDPIHIDNWLNAFLMAIEGEQLEVVKLLLLRRNRILETRWDEEILRALKVDNEDILLTLLNEQQIKIDSLYSILEIKSHLITTLLTHPNFKLSDSNLQEIQSYLMRKDFTIEYAVMLLRVPNLFLNQSNQSNQYRYNYIVSRLLTLACRQDYPLQSFLEILEKNTDRGIIKSAILDVLGFIDDRKFDNKTPLQLIPLGIKYDLNIQPYWINKLIQLFRQNKEIDKEALVKLSVSRNYQAMIVQTLFGFSYDSSSQEHSFIFNLLSILIDMDYAKDSEFRNMMFHTAATCGLESVVHQIMEMPGYDVNVVDKYGQTALINAARFGHLKVLAALYTAKELDVNIRYNNLTAQELAYSRRDVYHFMELQKIKKQYINKEDSLLSKFTLFSIGRTLGAFTHKQIYDAIDSLSAVILGEVSLESVREYEDIFLGIDSLRDIYILMKGELVASKSFISHSR